MIADIAGSHPEPMAWADRSDQAIIIYGPDGGIRFWNVGAERIFGWSAAEATSGGAASPLLRDEWFGATEADCAFQPHVRRRMRNGEAIDVRLWRHQGAAIGRPELAVIEFCEPLDLDVDIPGKAAEPSPLGRGAQVPERFDILLEHMPIALWQVDIRSVTNIFDRLRGENVTDLPAYLAERPTLIDFICETVTIIRVNRAAADLIGARDSDACLGPVRPLFELSPDAALRITEAHYLGARNHAEEIRLRRHDGGEIDVLFLATYPRPPEDMTVAFLAMFDIGDRLRAERALHDARADFARATAHTTMGEVVTSIAHELRQPLGAIVTNCEASLRWLTRAEPNIPKVRQLSDRAVEAAIRASDIIDGIQAAAAPGKPRHIPVDIAELVDRALHLVRDGGQADGADLSWRQSGAPGPIVGDPMLLQQVIVNLTMNSLQAIDPATSPPRVSIIVENDEAGATISVLDNGPGFPEADLHRVFSGFYTTKPSGFGIGLTLCRSIVQAHGGTIEAGNQPSGGAIVRISLPCRPMPYDEGALATGLMA
ncbi:PAS domain-containing sensor histidine kinase [Sphingomonas crocodyli]|uniref:histidine kinase n=1 Tax=Sphingomonas crocodyli TaxID=1979270 RepID=A0A437LZP7_9SPHN|nr:PAS domain-containing sensor histidine kinase [Sphingomonas crocodyli]RVT90908.1 PAS domain-containing sensor histidine kinase [Sphingomonas crocodyli]